MKTIMTAALALSLMAGSAAFAQDRRDDRGDRGGDRGGEGVAHNRAGQPLLGQGQPPQQQFQRQAPTQAAPQQPAPQQQRQFQAPQQQQPQAQPQFQGRQGDNRGQRFDRNQGGQAQNFDRNRAPAQNFDRGRGNEPRFGAQGRFDGGQGYRPRQGGFLDSNRWSFSQRFQGPAYRYPRGFGYRYFGFGSFLPGVFLSQDYSLYDYWTYGLPAPPPGYRWIRVGPDALLVRYGDGYVLDAAYGLFF